MWTEITRPRYERSGRRYASDATDAEWSHIAPLLPSAKPGGRPRTTNLRDVFDAILYMASTGCQWRMLPNDYPPVSTVRRYFYDWRDNGVLRTINHYLVMAAREARRMELANKASHPTKHGKHEAAAAAAPAQFHDATDVDAVPMEVEMAVHSARASVADTLAAGLANLSDSPPDAEEAAA